MNGTGINSTVPNAGEQLYVVLGELGSRARELFGAERVIFAPDLRLERPFSVVHRVQASTSQPLPSLYIKLARQRSTAPGEFDFMARRVSRDFDTTRRMYLSLSGHPELSVPRPVACFPHHLAIVTEEARGQTLLTVLETHARWWATARALQRLSEAMRLIGRWICVIQEADPCSGDVSLDEMREYLEVRLRRLGDLERGGLSPNDRQSVLRGFDCLGQTLSQTARQRVVTHGDLAPGNILVDDSGITVLDLAMSGTGTRLHDIVHLYLQLELLRGKPWFRRPTVDTLKQALLTGYGPAADPDSPLFQLMYLQHRVCHLIGLTATRTGLVERAYNTRLVHRHLSWIRAFSARAAAASRSC